MRSTKRLSPIWSYDFSSNENVIRCATKWKIWRVFVVYVSKTRREGGYLEDSRSEVARPAITGLSQAVISRSAYIDKVYKL